MACQLQILPFWQYQPERKGRVLVLPTRKIQSKLPSVPCPAGTYLPDTQASSVDDCEKCEGDIQSRGRTADLLHLQRLPPGDLLRRRRSNEVGRLQSL